jgi:hypothetical protein
LLRKAPSSPIAVDIGWLKSPNLCLLPSGSDYESMDILNSSRLAILLLLKVVL